jgi:outer membrane protein assembly factor BamB
VGDCRQSSGGTSFSYTNGSTCFARGNDGQLEALDLQSGQLRWRYDTLGLVKAAAGGTVYVSEYGAETNVVAALDAATGALRWQTLLRADDLAASDTGTLTARGRDGLLQVLDAATGSLRWSLAPRDDEHSTVWTGPELADQTLHLAADDELRTYDVTTGEQLWTYWTYWNESIGGVIAVAGNTTFVSTGVSSGSGSSHRATFSIRAITPP